MSILGKNKFRFFTIVMILATIGLVIFSVIGIKKDMKRNNVAEQEQHRRDSLQWVSDSLDLELKKQQLENLKP